MKFIPLHIIKCKNVLILFIMANFKYLNQREQIISLYQEGKLFTEIASILGSDNISRDAGSIRRLLIHELGQVTSNKKNVMSQYESAVLQYAREGKKPKEMGLLLGINPTTIDGWFRNNHPEFNFLPNKGNVHYFHTIDSYAKAYIVGFIAADGALVESKQSKAVTLTITIKYEDKEVLEFIKSEIGNSHKLQEIIRPTSYNRTKIIHHIRYAISDKNIASDLNNLGITSNKSLTIGNIIENIPYEYRDAFIIGYFDGDGSVITRDGLYKNFKGALVPDHSIYIQMRGTKEFLKGICNHLNITDSHIHQYDSIPSLQFANKKDVVRFFQCYNNLPFYYKRKYDMFLKRINHPSFDKYKQDPTISSSTH